MKVRKAMWPCVFVLVLGAMLGCDAGALKSNYYDLVDRKIVHYPVPKAAAIESVAYVYGTITFTTAEAIGALSDPLAFGAYFNAGAQDDALLDKGVLFVVNTAAPFSGYLGSHQGAVLDIGSGAVLGTATGVIDGTTVTVTFDPALVSNAAPGLAVSYYYPALLEGRIFGGLEAAVATVHAFDDSGTDVNIALPRFWDGGSPLTFEDVIVGPRGGARCPPKSGDPVIPWDVDGDPRTPDKKYKRSDTRDPNTENVLCWLAWVCATNPNGANSAFLGAYGHDDNGNGILDPGEVDGYFGMCVYPNGINTSWIDSQGHYHWKCVDPDTGEVTHFEYDPATKILTVTVTHPDGTTEVTYKGPPDGYPGFPKKPKPESQPSQPTSQPATRSSGGSN